MKDIVKKNIIKYLLIYIILLAFFMLSLTITSLIPRSLIEENAFESAKTLYEEGEYAQKNYFNIEIKNDNYADAIMINNAYSMDPSTPLYSALIVRRNYIPEKNTKVLAEEVGDPIGNTEETVDLLKTTLKTQQVAKEYAKYWHGYLIYLKPLLILFNYNQIRIIQLMIIIVLLLILVYLINKKIGLFEAIIFLIGFLTVNLELVYTCLEFSPIFVVMLGVSIVILIRYEKIRDIKTIFFISGIVACFFDFLTAPVTTLGIPLLLYFLLRQKEKKLSSKEILTIFLKNCLAWAIGYGLIWITKFLLVDIIYHKGLLVSGLKQVKHRTAGRVVDTWLNFIMQILQNCNLWLILMFCFIEIVALGRFSIIKMNRNKIFTYLLISLLPIGWYFVLREHSMQHVFMTYRTTMVLWISLMLIIHSMIDENYGDSIKKLVKYEESNE